MVDLEPVDEREEDVPLARVVTPGVGETSAQGTARGVVGEGSARVAEARAPDTSPPRSGSDYELPLPLPTESPRSGRGRRGRFNDLYEDMDEGLRARLERLETMEEELREARILLSRDRELMGAMVNVPGGGGASGAPARSGPAGNKNIVPREYSPKGGVGPGKWLFHLEMYFQYGLVTGEDRVHHGAMLLRDAAESWWRSHVIETTTPEGGPAAGRIVTWEAFKESLGRVFTPVPEREQARARLYELRQLGSVQGYTQAFRELLFVTDDLAPSERKPLYLRGLKPHILREVRLRFPSTLDDAILIAEQVDTVGGTSSATGPARMAARVGAGQRNSPARSPFRRAKPQGASMHVVGARHEGSGLELVVPDAMPAAKARTGAVVAGVRPAQRRGPGGPRAKAPGDGNRERLRREGRCFQCEQLGHIAKDCPGNAPRRRE